MPSYKITKVSEHEPKPVYSEKWKSTTYYIKCMLEDVERPVEIGKKKPDALSAGMTVDGTIIPKPDFDADGFKADPIAPPSSGYSGAGKPAYQPKDEEAIVRQSALKSAVALASSTDSPEAKKATVVLDLADTFLTWLKLRPEAPKDDEPLHESHDF